MPAWSGWVREDGGDRMGTESKSTRLKISQPVYSTRERKFMSPTAKSKARSSQCFRSARLSEFDFTILLPQQPSNEVP